MRKLSLACSIATLPGFVGTTLWSTAFANDLEMLTRLLTSAYMAQNFTVLCTDQDTHFLSDVNDGAALLSAFAEHVKKVVTIDLPESEAEVVRVTAADTALHVARQELRLLGRQSVPADALRKWCDRSAKHFIIEILSKHQERHDEFDRLVDGAKR